MEHGNGGIDTARPLANKTSKSLRQPHAVKLLSQIQSAGQNPPAKQGRTVGVEIGPDRIRMVLLEPSLLGNFRVANFLSQPIDAFAPLDSAHLAEAIREGLTALAGTPKDLAVWAGISHDRVRVHHLKLPQMKPSHLAQAVYWALQREEAFSAPKTIVDFEVEKEIAANGKKELLISGFLMPVEDRDALVNAFREAGFPLRGIALPLYATRNFFRSGWISASGETFVFSHIGTQTSRIGVWSDGQSILSRAIPVGLEQIAEELTHVLRPAPSRAEAIRLILDLGRTPAENASRDSEHLFQSIQPALDRMARQIDRTLEYYRTQFPDREAIGRVYLTGAIAESPRCAEYFASQIAAPLQLVDPFANETAPAEISPPAHPAQRHAFATAFGLALSNPAYTPNFLHTYKDRQRDLLHHRINHRIFAFFCVLAILLGGFFAFQRTQIHDLRTQRAAAESRLQSQRPLISAADVQDRLGSLRSEFNHLTSQLDRHHALALLSDLSLLTPENVQLNSISAVFGDPNKKASPSWLRVSGFLAGDRATLETDLVLYLRNLQSSPLFINATSRDRNIRETENASILDFSLEISLAPPQPATPTAK